MLNISFKLHKMELITWLKYINLSIYHIIYVYIVQGHCSKATHSYNSESHITPSKIYKDFHYRYVFFAFTGRFSIKRVILHIHSAGDQSTGQPKNNRCNHTATTFIETTFSNSQNQQKTKKLRALLKIICTFFSYSLKFTKKLIELNWPSKSVLG